MNTLQRLSLGLKSTTQDLNDVAGASMNGCESYAKSDTDESRELTDTEKIEDGGNRSTQSNTQSETLQSSSANDDSVPFIDGGFPDSDNQDSRDVLQKHEVSVLLHQPDEPSLAMSSANIAILSLSDMKSNATDIIYTAVSSSISVCTGTTETISRTSNNVNFPLSSTSVSVATEHKAPAISSSEPNKKYSSPFVYASPYSSYSARRTSLRSPSLWANERVSTLPYLASTVTKSTQSRDYRRTSYVTPTFGGNDENIIPTTSALLSSTQMQPKTDQKKTAIETNSKNNTTNSTSILANGAEESLMDNFMSLSASENTERIFDPVHVLNSYVASDSHQFSRKVSGYRRHSSSYDYCNESKGSSSYSGRAALTTTSPSQCSPAPASSASPSTSHSCNSSSGSRLAEQKRMSVIDSRLKELPEQLSVARVQLAGDGGDPAVHKQNEAAVMQRVLKFGGE